MRKFKQFLNGLTMIASFAVIAIVLPSGQTVAVPQTAINHSPALESVTFIHYRDGQIRPEKPPKGGTNCYTFISKGAKLISAENILVNPSGSGMTDSYVASSTASSATEWDNHTSATLWETINLDYTSNFDSIADGLNEISFGHYDNPNVIAVTKIWGIFSGPSANRKIDQFDILFNTAFDWGDVVESGNTALMDYINIATHEIGHGLGLSDLYNTCAEETMYGYSTEGETKKRDLNAGDIQGLVKLYGI